MFCQCGYALQPLKLIDKILLFGGVFQGGVSSMGANRLDTVEGSLFGFVHLGTGDNLTVARFKAEMVFAVCSGLEFICACSHEDS